MTLRIPHPWKHPKTGVLDFLAQILGDVLERVAGERVTIAVADIETTIRIAPLTAFLMRISEYPYPLLVRHSPS